ncbi:hypothetical protein TIFTF001_014516 [Ficus carica]|uniref:RRM domain-containing protein n=1 Tax=Ficus carica TaxID=3494 RepID=A0AA88D473_FICCA|nr:hypothetical protein TIFTF001_014516 [Ficus carica]
MSHFGRSGPPDIRDTYSLLVLNITFRTTADDLFPLFDRYGKVVDVFIPRDRRTGESRGFAFVRYKYADEAQKAVEKLDGRVVDGREIMVQFAKYGPNAERIHKGRIIESASKLKGRSRSRSPRPRYRDEYKEKDKRRSRSRSRDRYDRDRYHRSERESNYRSRSRSASPDHHRDRGRARYDDERRSRSRSYGSASPVRRSPKSRRSPSPRRTPPRGENPEIRDLNERSPASNDASPRGRRAGSRSPSPRRSDAEVSPCVHSMNDGAAYNVIGVLHWLEASCLHSCSGSSSRVACYRRVECYFAALQFRRRGAGGRSPEEAWVGDFAGWWVGVIRAVVELLVGGAVLKVCGGAIHDLPLLNDRSGRFAIHRRQTAGGGAIRYSPLPNGRGGRFALAELG